MTATPMHLRQCQRCRAYWSTFTEEVEPLCFACRTYLRSHEPPRISLDSWRAYCKAMFRDSHEPPRNSGEGDAVNGPTPLAGGDESHTAGA